MENPTFYWYDFETFGLDKETDRPSQFAGQRTDLSFNPIGEGEVFYNKPSMDYLPSAQSCLLTGITPQICMSEGVVESEFAQEVWNRLNGLAPLAWATTVSLLTTMWRVFFSGAIF